MLKHLACGCPGQRLFLLVPVGIRTLSVVGGAQLVQNLVNQLQGQVTSLRLDL